MTRLDFITYPASRDFILSLVFLLAFSGCSSDSTAPERPNIDTPGQGVLLEGDPAAPAAGALTDFPPIPAPEDEIRDGLFLTRLTVALDPDATVGDVNGELERRGALIVSMIPGDPFLTLQVPPLGGEAEARAMADTLASAPAFLYAAHEFVPGRGGPSVKEGVGRRDKVLPPSGEEGLAHLDDIRLIPAWNARRLVAENGDLVNVWLPDFYADDALLEQLPALEFATGRGIGPLEGNAGFISAGIVAAAFDDAVPTGVHPGPDGAITTWAQPLGGLTWPDIIRACSPRGFAGETIVAIPLEYGGVTRSLFRKVIDAMRVRQFNHRSGDLVCAFAGTMDPGQESPWTLATYPADDLGELLVRDELAGNEIALLDNLSELRDRLGVGYPENIMIVGAADESGVAVTSAAASVQFPGYATSTCTQPDADCQDGVAAVDDPWVAVPQAAGLAAYLKSLRPELALTDLQGIMAHAQRNTTRQGVVDAYLAVLSLDPGLDRAEVRRTLLDVTDRTGVLGLSDGRFDEHDIEAFLDGMSPVQIHSRLDLNGDGFTGPGTMPMDLNVDLVPAYDVVQYEMRDGCFVNSDETAVSDLDALIYYAFSPLYQGDTDERLRLLGSFLPGDCDSGGEEEIVIAWEGTLINYDYGDCGVCDLEPASAVTIQNGTELTFLFGPSSGPSGCPEFPSGAEIIMTTTVHENWSGFSGVGVRPNYSLCTVRDSAMGLAVTADLSGDTLSGSAFYQNNCENDRGSGCFYDFTLTRVP